MSALETVLVVLGVGAMVVSALTSVLARGAYAPIHLAGPAATVALPLIGLSVALAEGFGSAGLKALLAAGVMAATAPVLTAATGHARLRAGSRGPSEDPREDT